MTSLDLIKMTSSNLARRKSRTALTVLGIVIGTISIVVMIALGLGMQKSINSEFEDVTSVNIIEVTKGDNITSDTRQSEQDDDGNIHNIDLEFLENIEGVEGVSPAIETTIKLLSGKYEATYSLIGIDISELDLFGFEVEEGRLLTSDDTDAILFGSRIYSSFKEVASSSNNSQQGSGLGMMPAMSGQKANMRPNMGGGPPDMGPGGMGRGPHSEEEEEEEETESVVDIFKDRVHITLDTNYSPQSGNSHNESAIYRLNAAGVLTEDFSTSRYAYMDINTLEELIEDYNNDVDNDQEEGYDKAYVKVTNMDDVSDIESYIEDYGYETQTTSSFVDTMQSTLSILQIVLGAIGAVALLVAAIGITNTMIMAIQERKKEIGVMKVIGATLNDIKFMFLLESAMIGFIGGSIGILLSYGFTELLSTSFFNDFANKSTGLTSMIAFYIPSWLILVGIVFTTFIGITSGYIPALQAMRSSALEALKTE